MKYYFYFARIKKLILLSLFLACFLSSHAQTDPNQPNILLIIADDLGIDASNGYQQNALAPVTPTLDSLRANGLTFMNAWAAPKCTPSRAAIISGKYGVKTGVTKTPGHLDVSHTSLFKELDSRTNGAYANAVLGKWHVSSSGSFDQPAAHGVDYYEGSFSAQVDDYYGWKKVKDEQETDEDTYVTKYITNQAIDWIGQQNQPWLMWLAHVAPHSPFQVPPAGTFSISNPTSNKQKYIAMIENMDYEIGRLLGQMSEAVRNNTIIIFIGDNGTPNGALQYYPTGRGKSSVYQGGVNVPLIVSGLGISRKGEEEDALVHVLDLHATILELTGSDLPGGIHNSLSFDHLLSGTTGVKRKYNYSELDNDWVIRNEQYKLINFASGQQEFYDLIDDPTEESDLLGAMTTDQQNIKTELEAEAADIRNGWSCADGIQNGTETSIDECGMVGACSSDNSTSYTNIGCCVSPSVPSEYTEFIHDGKRKIWTNDYPNHDYCFSAAHTPAPQYYKFEVDPTPEQSGNIWSVTSDENRPDYYFGVALNGVLIAPAPATPFIFENPNTGEYNWDWVFEPINNQGSGMGQVKLDCASAHTGPQGYHYHGNMFQYVEQLQAGISITDMPPSAPLQIGWASDGYPIIYRFGPDADGNMKELQSGWQLKQGERPGDGVTAPCGEYNGKYTVDYEHVASSGDLDECNGMNQNITLQTASGMETFDYFYVITNEFPQVPRCVTGFRDESFNNSNKGSTTSIANVVSNPFQLSLSPNPTIDQTMVNFTPSQSGDYQLSIFTLSGNEVMTHTESVYDISLGLNVALDVEDLPKGLYLIQVRMGEWVSSEKLLKL